MRAGSGVTMHDVARAAGVSAITVSRALKQPGQVSQELREKIARAVDMLGYVPSRSASALASARSRTALVLIPSLSNTVFLDTLSGIEDVLQPAGYQMLIGNYHYDSQQELQLLRAYLQHRPDGVLITGLAHEPQFDALLSRHALPAVYMMDLADDGRCCVGFSQEDAGAAMARHLLAQGRRKIGFLGAQLDERVMKRLAGYRLALHEAGRHDAALEWLNPAPSSMQMGADMLDAALAQRPDCDALFCCNDDLALGALFRCREKGIAVPERLAVAGFNDLQAAAWSTPPLTTVATPRRQIGEQAARQLLRMLEDDAVEAASSDLGFQLMLRRSS
ncbi:LacI family DNA-binding transcriptional regulator [Chromobacterium sp. IIBBL 290-4]|uniref:LacI family DNA-binding transcriptional regulator n=1 Tax=Chromobacterium sp. IIBBL 290-4 TaxID=2953890 RepID=UPI0020B75A1A|nr:LacI family DNA-binding transcriptional regulator [Chromobacterium sp. IIBBL 290-4]UTH73381.1 LacI family DNA-binding transcriptional regulator [Chromobacterium sp. IIBBL 290-4]